MRNYLLQLGLASMVFSSAASASTVQLGLKNVNPEIQDRVSESAYRLMQGGWDHMISNGAAPAGEDDMDSIDYTGATALNGTLWDFTLSYESGDDGVKGFSFQMSEVDGRPLNSGTVVYDVDNPLNGETPTAPFNSIMIGASAGPLIDINNYDETAYIDIFDLAFISSLPSSGSFENPLNASWPAEEFDSAWILSSVDLSLYDWSLSGKVNAGFDCNGLGSAGCLNPDSLRMNLLVANSTVPVPAAVWLFGSALGLLGWKRRKRAV
ncbi:MAG: VPLPA-CTERM sorting domain-containing protein [Gammaproteobacteria bacterium]